MKQTAMSEQAVQPLQLNDLTFRDVAFTGITLSQEITSTKQFYVSLTDSISRILTTRIGERVMQPEFGSDLYLLRDRDFNSAWRVTATRYIFEALKKWEPRVRFKQLHFSINAITGQHYFFLSLEPSEQ